jgi:hypothetical protein
MIENKIEHHHYQLVEFDVGGKIMKTCISTI